jgi:phospholipase D1/2
MRGLMAMDVQVQTGLEAGRSGGMDAPEGSRDALPDLQVMLTAREAFPYLEDMFLTARTRLAVGFRIFDPETRLVSDAAKDVGHTWADLVAHTLARGVHVTLVISDFDPVGAPELHRTTHRSLRQFRAAAEQAGAAGALDAVAHQHPATSGPIFRVLFAPLSRRELAGAVERLRAQGPHLARARLADMPRLAPLVTTDSAGELRPRRAALPVLWPCTHHQKIAVADGRRLYIGGLDLDDRRRDSPAHDRAASETWHDVQIGLTGPVAEQAEAHLDAFRGEVERRQRPAPRPGLLRTLSGRRRGLGRLRLGPRPLVSEIYLRTLSEIREARALIYLESQFLRDVRFARALAARGRAAPDLGLICVLPSAPEDVALMHDHSLGQRFGEHLQAKCVAILDRAFGDRAAYIAPAQPRGVAPDGTRAVLHGAPIVYVHAKVTVVDDRAALVSSANLNGRSHRWDTEAGVALEDAAQVLSLRDRLMRHWLPEDAGAEFFDPAAAPGAWRALAEANSARQPGEREGFLLPYPERAPRRFGRPVPFLPQDMM